jgi:hypothetical protein
VWKTSYPKDIWDVHWCYRGEYYNKHGTPLPQETVDKIMLLYHIRIEHRCIEAGLTIEEDKHWRWWSVQIWQRIRGTWFGRRKFLLMMMMTTMILLERRATTTMMMRVWTMPVKLQSGNMRLSLFPPIYRAIWWSSRGWPIVLMGRIPMPNSTSSLLGTWKKRMSIRK